MCVGSVQISFLRNYIPLTQLVWERLIFLHTTAVRCIKTFGILKKKTSDREKVTLLCCTHSTSDNSIPVVSWNAETTKTSFKPKYCIIEGSLLSAFTFIVWLYNVDYSTMDGKILPCYAAKKLYRLWVNITWRYNYRTPKGKLSLSQLPRHDLSKLNLLEKGNEVTQMKTVSKKCKAELTSKVNWTTKRN